jgi:hypothetical protein
MKEQQTQRHRLTVTVSVVTNDLDREARSLVDVLHAACFVVTAEPKREADTADLFLVEEESDGLGGPGITFAGLYQATSPAEAFTFAERDTRHGFAYQVGDLAEVPRVRGEYLWAAADGSSSSVTVRRLPRTIR